MFSYAGYNSKIFSLNLSAWDTSKVKSAVAIFQYAGRNSEKFSLDLSNWNTSNVTANE